MKESTNVPHMGLQLNILRSTKIDFGFDLKVVQKRLSFFHCQLWQWQWQ